MLTIAVRGKSVVISEGFETALREYARANYQQGNLKKKDAFKEPELHQAENNAWRKLYAEMAKMFEIYHAEVIGEHTELLHPGEQPSQGMTLEQRVENLEREFKLHTSNLHGMRFG